MTAGLLSATISLQLTIPQEGLSASRLLNIKHGYTVLCVGLSLAVSIPALVIRITFECISHTVEFLYLV